MTHQQSEKNMTQANDIRLQRAAIALTDDCTLRCLEQALLAAAKRSQTTV